MKRIATITLGLCLLGIVNTKAADEVKKERRQHQVSEETLKKYDKNGDGKLDASERKVMHEDMVKKYDKNGDGKLDEKERAAMREDMKKKAQEHRDADKKADDKK